MSDEELTAFLRDLPFLRAAEAANRIEQLNTLNEVLVELLDSANQDIEKLREKLAQATWLLTEAAVQLVEGKIKTRKNRAAIILNLLEELKEESNAP